MKITAIIVLVLACFGASSAMAVENKGAEQITINGGERGVVAFPHHRHQSKLGDCQICHAIFPQEPGAIERLKKEEKLVPKQVMNKLCIKCHKAEKEAGRKAGPVTCTQCHHRG